MKPGLYFFILSDVVNRDLSSRMKQTSHVAISAPWDGLPASICHVNCKMLPILPMPSLPACSALFCRAQASVTCLPT